MKFKNKFFSVHVSLCIHVLGNMEKFEVFNQYDCIHCDKPRPGYMYLTIMFLITDMNEFNYIKQ